MQQTWLWSRLVKQIQMYYIYKVGALRIKNRKKEYLERLKACS